MTRFNKRIALALLAALPLLAAFHAQAQASAASAGSPADGGAAQVSSEAGRELFGTHCTRCHGADAKGTANGPNLLPRVKGMSEAGFSSAVLQRYRWSVPAAATAGESGAREALLRGVLSRQGGASGGMPAWQSQPEVVQGVKALFSYLSALTKRSAL